MCFEGTRFKPSGTRHGTTTRAGACVQPASRRYRVASTSRCALRCPTDPETSIIFSNLLDALTAFNLIDDDKLVTRLAAEWAAAVEPGMVEVQVRQFDRGKVRNVTAEP